MNLSIDTGIIFQAFGKFSLDHLDLLIKLIPRDKNRPKLYLCYDVDNTSLIEGAYENCSRGFPRERLVGYRDWISRLHQRQAIYSCSGKIPAKHLANLKKLGCDKDVDLVFIGVAYRAKGILVSENARHGKALNGERVLFPQIEGYLNDKMYIKAYNSAEAINRLSGYLAFQLILIDDRTQLVLPQEVQDNVLKFIRDFPETVTILESKTRGNIFGYVFEVQVQNYLQRLGYTAEHSKKIEGFDGDIDVYAERGDEILICECETHENAEALIRSRKVTQIIDRLEFLKSRKPNHKITAWIASTATKLEDETNQWEKITSHENSIQVMYFPRKTKVIQRVNAQNWAAILRENWFIDSEVRQLYPE